MTKSTFWDQDWRTDILKAMHADRKSSGAIAEELGCTRNAIIGKLNRLGLRNTIKSAAPRQPPPTPKFEPPQVIETLPIMGKGTFAPPTIWKELVDLSFGDCRYPIDRPDGGYLFCSLLAVGSYCPSHAELCYHRRPVR